MLQLTNTPDAMSDTTYDNMNQLSRIGGHYNSMIVTTE